jgi:hypothetical protein
MLLTIAVAAANRMVLLLLLPWQQHSLLSLPAHPSVVQWYNTLGPPSVFPLLLLLLLLLSCCAGLMLLTGLAVALMPTWTG